MNASAAQTYIGLMSGTSVDAIDAVLVAFDPRPRLIGAIAVPYAADLRELILQLSIGKGATSLAELGQLDVRIGRAFADAATELLEKCRFSASAVRAIGSHGQTVWHAPAALHPFSTQLGDPNQIAEITAIDTVADFRRRDIAAGGEGAPLVPAFHAAFLHSSDEDRAVLNLGGIANLTLLPAAGPVRGFDTGPANALLDLWTERHTGERFDCDGAFAAGGRVDHRLLQRLLDDPYFARRAPKSTGRDVFNLNWLEARMLDANLDVRDTQATLLMLSARSVAEALKRELPTTRRLLVCGGGARNARLLQSLGAELPNVEIGNTADYAIDPDFLEAMAFAWLARETIEGRPGNLPEVTGARGRRILGGIFRG